MAACCTMLLSVHALQWAVKLVQVCSADLFWDVLQQGSTTACVLCLEGEQLHAANVGDSGFMVVRENEIVFKSPPQQHSFNFPYQLGPKDKGYQTPNDAQVSPPYVLMF